VRGNPRNDFFTRHERGGGNQDPGSRFLATRSPLADAEGESRSSPPHLPALASEIRFEMRFRALSVPHARSESRMPLPFLPLSHSPISRFPSVSDTCPPFPARQLPVKNYLDKDYRFRGGDSSNFYPTREGDSSNRGGRFIVDHFPSPGTYPPPRVIPSKDPECPFARSAVARASGGCRQSPPRFERSGRPARPDARPIGTPS
jgi:hypothetical protein